MPAKFAVFLKEHPEYGLFSSVVASVQSFIETSTPVLQYVGLVLGILIGVVTLAIKLREAHKKFMDR